MHTVTFSHRFLLFGSKLELPWDCGTIQNHAKTLPCACSLILQVLLMLLINHFVTIGPKLAEEIPFNIYNCSSLHYLSGLVQLYKKMLFLELVQKYGTHLQNIFVIVRKKNSPRSCIH